VAARVFPVARWIKIFSAIAMVPLVSGGVYFIVWPASWFYRLAGPFMVVFGVAGFADMMVSRIVLDDEEIRIISLVRTRRYPRSDFQSAKVSGGAVVLARQDGGWLVLPDTGLNALGMRNTVHAWINRK
jgi:hypothetical protein